MDKDRRRYEARLVEGDALWDGGTPGWYACSVLPDGTVDGAYGAEGLVAGLDGGRDGPFATRGEAEAECARMREAGPACPHTELERRYRVEVGLHGRGGLYGSVRVGHGPTRTQALLRALRGAGEHWPADRVLGTMGRLVRRHPRTPSLCWTHYSAPGVPSYTVHWHKMEE